MQALSGQHDAGPRLPPTHWLEAVELPGGRRLPSRLFPGPMEGVTQEAMVRVYSRRDLVKCWVTPFIRVSQAMPRRIRVQEKLAPFLATGLPVVVQLMGTSIGVLAGVAKVCQDLGAVAVDLNCACPSPTVIASGAGAARLRMPHWIRHAVEAIRQACPEAGVSLKLRSGVASASEMDGILPLLADAPLDLLFLHFRTADEMYAPVDNGWARLARARALLPNVRLIGCGDVRTPADALALAALVPLDGIAVARGLLANPWLLCDIEAALRGAMPPQRGAAEALAMVAELADELPGSASNGTGFLLGVARRALGEDSAAFAALARETTPGAIAAACRSLL